MRARSQRKRGQRGSTLLEFSFTALLLFMVLFTMFEFFRMALVMTALADATRAGMRYAIVHGSDNPSTKTQVETVIKNFASTGSLNTAAINFPTDTYATTLAPGSTITITTTYTYNPFTSYIPLGFTMSTTSSGIVTF